MALVIRCFDLLFGKGDDDHPFWLLTVRINVLVFLLGCALLLLWKLRRARSLSPVARESYGVLALTGLAILLRFVVASANLLDFGGIPYSRLLYGYKGYYATAQVYSLLYELSARDIEHAILFNRIAGTLTIPLVYVLCRRLRPAPPSFPAIAAFLFAVYPLHILLSASDALAVFSLFLAASVYAILAGAGRGESRRQSQVRHASVCAGLSLLSQVRYENLLLLLPPLLFLWLRRHRQGFHELLPGLLLGAAFLTTYVGAAAAAGLSYQNPWHPWLGLDLVITHVVWNPFLCLPLLFVATLVIAARKQFRLALLALAAWVGPLVLAIVTSEDGHGAARVYANWLILLLPFAAYGLSLLLAMPRRLVRIAAAAVLLYLGIRPLLIADVLATRYLEIVENDWFKRTLERSAKWMIVPDDELISRQPHSTLELYRKYVMIHAALPAQRAAPQLVGLTEFLERPQPGRCAEGACLFFFGLPCVEPGLYPLTSAQCQEVLHKQRTTRLDEISMVAAPFIDCSIYSGHLRDRFCHPETKRFAVYRIEE